MGVIMFAYICVSVLMLAISAEEGSVAFFAEPWIELELSNHNYVLLQ